MTMAFLGASRKKSGADNFAESVGEWVLSLLMKQDPIVKYWGQKLRLIHASGQ